MKNRVLVLDGNQRSALAVTRSLGQKRITVICAETSRKSLCGFSRYSAQNFSYPSPSEAPSDFLERIRTMVAEHDINVVLPMTDITTSLLLKNRDVVGAARLPFPSSEVYDRLVNKQSLVALAGRLSIPVPTTHTIENLDERFDVYSRIRFPVVIKPVYSKVNFGDRWVAIGVQYASTVDELDDIVVNSPCVGVVPLMVQERIVGQGHGVFALYDHGHPVAFFSHRRLRERPPSGGVSVLSESVLPNPASKKTAETLLSHVGWHGVAMVEFKVDHAGTPFLIEVNGRFWGSLQLAIDSGVDFPHLLYRLAVGDRVQAPEAYSEGCRSRWLLGDLDRLYWVLRKDRTRYTVGERLRALAEFLRFFDSARHEVNRLDDFRPFIYELGEYIRSSRGSRV